MQASILEAKTHLSALLRKAQAGEKVILTMGREKTPVAELVPIQPLKKRPLGMWRIPGRELSPDYDFTEPMPAEDLRLWEGRDWDENGEISR